MSSPSSCIATSLGLFALLSFRLAAAGSPAGSVDAIDGTVLLERTDGSVRVLGPHSSIEESDTLMTRGGGRATLTLSDRTLLALDPDTNLRVEKFVFHGTPDATDAGRLLLLTGQVYIRAGSLGSRGPERLLLVTATAKVDVQNATLSARYIPAPITSSKAGGLGTARGSGIMAARAPAMRLAYAGTDWGALFSQGTPQPSAAGSPRPGLYVDVTSGSIVLSNSGGAQTFTAGQFGFAPSMTMPPVILPVNPGMSFTPPPVFASGAAAPGNTGSNTGPVDCVVR